MPESDPVKAFQAQKASNIERLSADPRLRELARAWVNDSARFQYTYHFSALGRPIIQFPQDMVALQEIIWDVRPDLIVETGIAHGGSLMLSASMLALLDYCDAATNGATIDPRATHRRVLAIDIDIRTHNRVAIESHPLAHLIEMFEGSSTSPEIIDAIRARAVPFKRPMVVLDSNHTHDHVLAELEAYAPLVAQGSYCVVFDTVIEDMPADAFPDRSWSRGNNPKTAVHEYMRRLESDGRRGADGKPLHFRINRELESKLMITVAPDGYLQRS